MLVSFSVSLLLHPGSTKNQTVSLTVSMWPFALSLTLSLAFDTNKIQRYPEYQSVSFQ